MTDLQAILDAGGPWQQARIIGDQLLIQGDCLEVMANFEPVGAIITDPPYSSGGAFRSDRAGSTAKKYMGSNGRPAKVQIDVQGDSRDSLGWAFWATLWLSQCYRLLPDGAPCIVFSDWRQLPNATNVLQSAGFVWRGVGVWSKPAYRPMSGRFAHQAEYFPWGTKGATPWDYELPCLPGVFSDAAPGANRVHQTEKPVSLIEKLLGIAKVQSTILDPFMGSGTTLVACQRLGRQGIGIELDPDYFEIACKRVQEVVNNPPLFTPAPPKPKQEAFL